MQGRQHPGGAPSTGRRLSLNRGYGGALAAPSTAYICNWNMLPIGQVLWLKELESYVKFPPVQDPASYNLTQVLQQVKQMGQRNPSQ